MAVWQLNHYTTIARPYRKINFYVINLIINHKKMQTLKSYTAKFYKNNIIFLLSKKFFFINLKLISLKKNVFKKMIIWFLFETPIPFISNFFFFFFFLKSKI